MGPVEGRARGAPFLGYRRPDLDLPTEEEGILFRVLPKAQAGRVFSYLPPQHQQSLLRSISSEQVRTLIEGMTPDDRTHLLHELPAEVTRRVLESLSPDEVIAARALLGYPEHSAGRYMTPAYVAIPCDATAGEALEQIRRVGRNKETLNVIYLLDEAGKLVEDIRLGALVLADPGAIVSDINRPASPFGEGHGRSGIGSQGVREI